MSFLIYIKEYINNNNINHNNEYINNNQYINYNVIFSDWRIILLIEHILIYWIYSYYILYNNNVDKKYYIPSKEVLCNVLTNQILGTLTFYFFNLNTINKPIENINLYEIFIIIIDMIILSIIQSIYFYIMHRLFHTKFLYKHIHYIHHKNYITIPYTAVNCDIIEHVLINIMSVLIGTKLWLCHQNSVIIWVWLSTYSSVNTHSNIIRQNNPVRHDFHHLLKNVNYGSGYEFMDKLFGTYKD
jgi:sterol desaturase/sphingolipid hydroxylase (fatty acid hydroxylase superfamily)